MHRGTDLFCLTIYALEPDMGISNTLNTKLILLVCEAVAALAPPADGLMPYLPNFFNVQQAQQ